MAKEKARTHCTVTLPLPSHRKMEMIIERTHKMEIICKI